MPIPRKQPQDNKGIQEFIQGAGTRTLSQNPTQPDPKRGRRIISVSLMDHDIVWLDRTLDTIKPKTARRVTRSEIVSTALDLLKKNNTEEILQIIKNR